MNPEKRSLKAFALLMGSYAVMAFLYVLPLDDVFLFSERTAVLFFLPAVFLYIYFSYRIIDKRVRSYLVSISLMIILWCVLRASKYIAFKEIEDISRFIWYLYYVPMLIIPQLSFQAALAVGEPKKRSTALRTVNAVITAICIFTVLSNDMHQLVFSFNPGFENWDFDYAHEPLFWVIVIWAYLFIVLSIVILFRKCSFSASRKLTWIPALYLALGVFALYLLNADRLPRFFGQSIGEFPEISCYALGGFWILCITIGLVPSNKGYGKLLEQTSLSAILANKNFEIVYQGSGACEMSAEQLASPTPVMLDENTVIYRKPVKGGYVYRQVDITELNQINRELIEAKERIAEEAELISRANSLKEKRSQIDAKSKSYDEIAVKVLPQSQKIVQLSQQALSGNAEFERSMRLVSIYAAYIKRISNMMLISSDGKIEKTELALALSESVRYLMKAGIPSDISGSLSGNTSDARAVISVYEQFENLLEKALPTLRAVHIVLSEDTVKITLEGAELTLTESDRIKAETDDGITFVRLFIGRGGDEA